MKKTNGCNSLGPTPTQQHAVYASATSADLNSADSKRVYETCKLQQTACLDLMVGFGDAVKTKH